MSTGLLWVKMVSELIERALDHQIGHIQHYFGQLAIIVRLVVIHVSLANDALCLIWHS